MVYAGEELKYQRRFLQTLLATHILVVNWIINFQRINQKYKFGYSRKMMHQYRKAICVQYPKPIYHNIHWIIHDQTE